MLLKQDVEPRKQRRRMLHSQWLSHIENCAKQQLNREDYCAQYGLSLKNFKQHAWLERRKNRQTTRNFAEIKIIDEAVLQELPYEIVYPRGVSLRIPASASLSTLLRSLEIYL